MIRLALCFVFLIFLNISVQSQRTLLPVDTASLYFSQIKQICRSDQNKIWGKPIWGPVIIVNQETRRLIASHRDGDGIFKPRGEVFIGSLPDEIPLGNGPVNFGGKTWAVVMVPLPDAKGKREKQFISELMKRHLSEAGFFVGEFNNLHFENTEARINLKLEWQALENAVKRSGEEHVKSIRDALIFRNLRRSQNAQNIADERRFEIYYGLSEYTAVRYLAKTPEEFKSKIFYSRAYHWKIRSFSNSFGYHSGLLYAYLLERKLGNGWQANLKKTDDLGEMLQKAYGIVLPGNLRAEADKVKGTYKYDRILAEETRSENRRKLKLVTEKTAYTKNAIVEMDLFSFNVGCNPKLLEPIDSVGTLYPKAKIVDDWGVLDVNRGGVIITFDQKKALLQVKNLNNQGKKITGDGWTLRIDENWELIQNGTNYKLQPKESAEINGDG